MGKIVRNVGNLINYGERVVGNEMGPLVTIKWPRKDIRSLNTE